MQRIMVTGGAGFIGVNFVYHWLQHFPGARIIVVDALTYAGNRSSLNDALDTGRVDFFESSILDQGYMESLLEAHDIDTIVHFAAESHVDRSISGPDAFIDTNVVGTHSLLKAARKVWLNGSRQKYSHRFHHISTDEVFGSLELNDPPFTEETKYAPNSPYSASKAASDHLVRAYHHTFGLNTTTSNCSNNYGPFHFPEKFIPLCITNILKGQKLPVYGDGKNIRDWLYVQDHCAGIRLVLENGKPGETYNIGGDNEWDNLSLVTYLCETMDSLFSEQPFLRERYGSSPMAYGASSRDLISFVTDRAGHDRRYAIDASKIRTELGYSPRTNFSSGIRNTIMWYVDNQDWWEKILSNQK